MRRILSTAVRPHALRVCTAALSALIPGLAAFAQYGPIDPFDSATAALRQSLFQANDGQQHAAMIALRELRDPQVRPLLQALLRGEDLSLRVDSVLGLAAIDPARKVDPTLIESLPRAADRETAVAAAIALEFADLNRIEQMLAWPGLDPSLRLLMACEQRRLGGEPDRAELMQWTNSRSPELAAVALALLLDIGALEASEAEARVRTMIAELPPKLRAEAVAQVAERCSIYALRGAASFVATLVSLPDVGGDARSRALGSLLVLDAPTGYPVFAQSLDADRSQLALMRHAAILLAAGVRAPASEWNRVRNGDQLLEAIADAGTALAQSDDAAAAKRLTQLKHRITLNAAVEGARRLGTSFDRALGLECLAILEENPRGLGPLLAPVMRALSRLAIVAPEELKLALERAQGRPELQDPMLLVLAASGSSEAASVARAYRGRSSRLGEALIAVLIARTQDSIDVAELQTLATVAGGAVQVDPSVRLQASWLWLRHSNRIDAAVESLVGISAQSPVQELDADSATER